jgi:branched-chain amino acid transport system substrate-binding protein
VGEVMIDALKRAGNGPIDFTAPVAAGSKHPALDVYVTPLYGGQWIKGTKYPFDLKIVSNAAAPNVTVQGKLESLA